MMFLRESIVAELAQLKRGVLTIGQRISMVRYQEDNYVEKMTTNGKMAPMLKAG